jgi:hypothetical protein
VVEEAIKIALQFFGRVPAKTDTFSRWFRTDKAGAGRMPELLSVVCRGVAVININVKQAGSGATFFDHTTDTFGSRRRQAAGKQCPGTQNVGLPGDRVKIINIILKLLFPPGKQSTEAGCWFVPAREVKGQQYPGSGIACRQLVKRTLAFVAGSEDVTP